MPITDALVGDLPTGRLIAEQRNPVLIGGASATVSARAGKVSGLLNPSRNPVHSLSLGPLSR
jgi:hypothetical protein